MEDILIPLGFFFSFGYIITFVTRTLSDNRVRRELLNHEVSPELVQKIFLDRKDSDFSANLKWGLVAVAVGIAFSIIDFATLDGDDPLSYAVVFIFGGAALLLFYFMQKSEAANQN